MSCLGSGESASVPTGILRARLTVLVTLAPERRPPLPGFAPWLILISTSRTRRRSAAWIPKCPLAACMLCHFQSSSLVRRIGPPSPEDGPIRLTSDDDWKWQSMQAASGRSEEHTSELQSRPHLACRPLLAKKKNRY